jgi:ABC-type nitrate/sulfonate/bicarbonate transport system ATPase subunit
MAIRTAITHDKSTALIELTDIRKVTNQFPSVKREICMLACPRVGHGESRYWMGTIGFRKSTLLTLLASFETMQVLALPLARPGS